MKMKTLFWPAAMALVFAAGVFGGRGASAVIERMSVPAPVAFADHGGLLRQAGAERVLFSLSTCPYCIQARAWLESNRIAFKELVVDQSPAAQRLFDELGEPALPVLVTRDRLIRGFAAEEYAQAIAPAAGSDGGTD